MSSELLTRQLERFMDQLLSGQLAHPLLLARELYRLSDLAYQEAESSLGTDE